MSTPTIRAALERLVEALNDYDPKWDAFPEGALTAARAALAAVPEGDPSDEELLRIASDCRALYVADDVDDDNYAEVLAAMRAAIAADRAAPPAPLEGEAGELVAWLRAYRDEEFGPLSDHPLACSLTRAAALLEQQAAELARLRSAPAVVPQPAPLAGLTAAQLQVLRDVLWSAQDEGPPGEGWASRQLQELREIVDAWQSAPPAVVPEAAEAVGDQHDEARRDQWLRIRWKLLAIAAELEGRHG